MKPSLCYTYCTLLLVPLLSCSALFIIVASENLKPSTGDHPQQHGAPSRESPGGNLVPHSVGYDATANTGGGTAMHPHPNEVTPGDTDSSGSVRTRGKPGGSWDRETLRETSNPPAGKPPGGRPLKKPSPKRSGKNSLKKDILTEKPRPQQDEPPDLKDVIFLETISKNVGVTNSGLQDIPGPPSIITLVDNQHHELNKIESKLEENLEVALKNLSHNNVHTGPPVVPLQEDDQQRHRQQLVDPIGGNGEDQANATIETAEGDESSTVGAEENEQPTLVVIPMEEGSTPTSLMGDVPSTQEPPGEDRGLKSLGQVNLTEENPMPVFSEWAQKQMAEAEKKLGEVVNASAMRKGTKPAGGKTGGGTMKLRAKNYAAPECGAKIIASNPEAQSTGSVLTAPKDEYLLNPCTSKIWFVVELCEPVQAERIELANFELFSSSPKEFTVSVSNRFPTRDWANVGQFTAKDERDVQSFQLHPHLFGKFVRVEILSHYNQEHFCPVSLFRVYGTSEFEAFETDNTPASPDEDDEEDDLLGLTGEEDKEMLPVGRRSPYEPQEPSLEGEGLPEGQKGREGGLMAKLEEKDAIAGRKGGKNPNNILKSAGEVVMSMVKKAAEALGKSGNDSNDSSERMPPGGSNLAAILPSSCVTLAYTIRCVNCTDRFRARLEPLMNCKHNLLTSLLGVARIERSFDSAQHFLCANVLGFNLPRSMQGETDGSGEVSPSGCLNMRYSVLNLLPDELVAGLCNVVAFDLKLLPANGHVPEVSENYETTIGDGEDSAAGLEHQSGTSGVPQSQPEDPSFVQGKIPVEEEPSPMPQSPQDRGQNGVQSENGHETTVPTESHKEDNTEGGSPSAPEPIPGQEDVNMFNIATEAPAFVGDSDRMEPSPTSPGSREQDPQPDRREKEEFGGHHWEAMDEGMMLSGGHHHTDLAGTGPSGSGASTSGPSAGLSTGMPTGPQKVQPESVFLRLSNRIKALERNMSLSGQYLEELSRRYRKQVEELQHSYAKTLHEIDEQNRRMRDSEATLREVNERLREDLLAFQATVADWRNIALAVLVVVIALLLTLLMLIRSVLGDAGRRGRTVANQQPVPPPQSVIDRELAQVGSDAKPLRGRMLRRKSIDGMLVGGGIVDTTGGVVGSGSGVIITSADPSSVVTSLSPARLRKKRPSEEALNISGTYVNLLIDEEEGARQVSSTPVALERKKSKQKHRKVSAPSMGGVSTQTVANAGRPDASKRSISMIEPFEQRWRVNGGAGDRSAETEHSDRIEELPFLEDNDEFIIPTASDLSYDEFMPGSRASTAEASVLPTKEVEHTMNGSGPPSQDPAGEDALDGGEQKKPSSKSSRRLSSPAFFKTSLLRSSLGSKKRSSKKSANGSGSSNTSGNSSSSNSSNISNNLSRGPEVGGGDARRTTQGTGSPRDSWNLWWSDSSKVSSSRTSVGGGDARGTTQGTGSPRDNWHLWWSDPSKVSSSRTSSQVDSSSADVSKQRQRTGKAKSEGPDGANAPREDTPVKLSVSFNGDMPVNGTGGSGNVLERKSSRGSIRRLFRKVF